MAQIKTLPMFSRNDDLRPFNCPGSRPWRTLNPGGTANLAVPVGNLPTGLAKSSTSYRSCRVAGFIGLTLLAVMAAAVRLRADNAPVLGAPVLAGVPGAAQLPLTNCTDTNFWYVIQTSTDLTNWVPFSTNFATSPTVPIVVAATNPYTFYQVTAVPRTPPVLPIFRFAIMTSSNVNLNGKYSTVDSFDSGNPLYSTVGQYDATKRKSNGSIATCSSIVGDTNNRQANIYGHVLTGPGTQQSSLQIGSNGAVGDLAWQATNIGIESGYWSGNFNLNVPDVIAPSLPGAVTSLPAPVGGVVTLGGGNYVLSPSDPNIGQRLNVTGNTRVWVQGSWSPANIVIATTNNARLFLYLGRATGSGDSLGLTGNTIYNQPGYAADFQLYGLPSLTSISLNGSVAFVGTIYAPEANVTGGGGGNNTMDSSGAMVLKSVTLIGNWNFHYDENLFLSGPVF